MINMVAEVLLFVNDGRNLKYFYLTWGSDLPDTL